MLTCFNRRASKNNSINLASLKRRNRFRQDASTELLKVQGELAQLDEQMVARQDAVRRTRIDELVEEGSAPARRVRRLIGDPARFISAFQVAITLSSLALGAIGEPAVSRVFENALGDVGFLGEGAAVVLSVILAFAIITALHVVLGEIVPKTWTSEAAAPPPASAASPGLFVGEREARNVAMASQSHCGISAPSCAAMRLMVARQAPRLLLAFNDLLAS